jgi:hypothetical protein
MPKSFYQHLKGEENSMTDSERSKILKMVEDGKITPEEGLRLMNVLGEAPLDDGDEPAPASRQEPPSPQPDVQSASEPDPDLAKTVATARSLWMIPLWIGVVITTFGGWIMYENVHSSAIGVWFFCLGFPIFFLGVLIILLGLGSRTACWLFVSVKQEPGNFPRRIMIGFPLPLNLASWFMRNFGHKIKGLRNIPVDQILVAVGNSEEPLIVNVDEGEEGEKVQVFIG